MNFKELVSELKNFPPFVQQKNDYIVEVTEELVDKYISFVEKVDVTEFENNKWNKKEILEKIRVVKELLLHSIHSFLDGQFGQAYDSIYKHFFDPQNDERIKMNFTRVSKLLYRIRSSESNHLFKREEMFHIPFEKRGQVKNQRYSISGYPCLYLGSSLYVCWEELGRPPVDNCNMVACESESQLYLVKMMLPNQIRSEYELIHLPLIIASALKVFDMSNIFKAEYIIPQIILQCIIKRNFEGGALMDGKHREIDGLVYLSTKNNDSQVLFKDKILWENFVVPIKKSKETGLCPELCKKFKMSNPISPNIEKIYNNQILAGEKSMTRYDSSLFGIMEKILKKNDRYAIRSNTKKR